MSKTTDKQYEILIERFLQQMDEVRAPVEDYRAALFDAKDQINVAIAASAKDGEDTL